MGYFSEKELDDIIKKGHVKIRYNATKTPLISKKYDEVTHKFNAKITERDGIKFRSKKEAKRYDELVLAKESGDIIFFLMQTPFHLPGNVKVVMDFVVFWSDGHVSIEDVKGKRTEQFIRNKKLVEALYPVTIEEK